MSRLFNPFKKVMNEKKDSLFQLVINNNPDAVHNLLTRSPLRGDIRDDGGFTPLMYAVNNGYNEMVRTLLFHYADANAVHVPSGWFPLLFAIDKDNNVALDNLLMVEEIDVNKVRVADNYTALHHAVFKDNLVAARKLIEHGADANMATNQGHTPLMVAIVNGHPNIVRLLLSVPGVAINNKNDQGQTPLMLAIKHRQPKIVTMLLSNEGINVNERDNDGYTALHYAVINNDPASAAKLIEEHADINALDNDNDTPYALLDIANGDISALKAVFNGAMAAAANRYPKKMKHKTAGGKRRHRRRKTKRHAK